MIEQIRQKTSGLFGGEADRGVSPVIGVILMVAITVILAAVIGAFVLGLGDDLGNSSGPQASLSFSEEGGTVTVTHQGGDSLNGEAKAVAGGDAGVTSESLGSLNGPGTSGTFDVSGSGTVSIVIEDTVIATYEA